MDLRKYNQKRNFDSTTEPKAAFIEKSSSELIFVVHQHAATHLHYDFRIEVNGVLMSWAIPKGPSMNPADKRLAIRVEDHPYQYKDFEGIIPEGNYGAGSVLIWDSGTYTLPDTLHLKQDEIENKIISDLKAGQLHFVLNGKKLKGEFALIQLKTKQKNAWLFIKKRDQYATESDVLKLDHSVFSDFTLKEISNLPK